MTASSARPYPALPLSLTTLVGREREIAATRDLLSRPEVRLVTLTGPGGIGKTRLALAVAEQLGDAFADGVAFVPLAAVRDPDLVPAAIAHTLDVRDAGQRSVVDSIASVIGDGQFLLVLDNFEQVLDAAPVVGALLVACRRLRVLVTSRAVLRLSGEHNVPVQPLALPELDRLPAFERLVENESVQLFAQRAREARADFALTEANAPAIAAICARVDGLPLAIELAAARVRLLSPQALHAQLEQRLRLLAGGPRDQPARLRTMHDAIGWSYDLLGVDERRLFDQLSVFSGGWTFEAAEAVCGDDADVLTGLGVLIDQSLVRQVEQPDGSTRFGLLEMVREFALEQLTASAVEPTARRRHAMYFLALAEEAGPRLDGSDQVYWLDRLTPEHANLSAALRWFNAQEDSALSLRMVEALGQYWFARGQLGEALALIDATLALSGAVAPTVARAGALKSAAWIAFWNGDLIRAEMLAEEGLTILRSAGEFHEVPYLLVCLGLVFSIQSDVDRARAAWEECVPLAREQGDMTSLARALSNLGWIAIITGDDQTALPLYSESLAIARAAHETGQMTLALEGLGRIASNQGDVEVAKQHFHEVLTIYFQIGSQWGIARMLETIADTILDGERGAAAARLHAAASVQRNRAGIPHWANEQPAVERRLAEIRLALGAEGFEVAWQAGTTMPVSDAVSEALAHVVASELVLQPVGVTKQTPPHGLTPRELDVLRLIVEGLSDREIGERLFISHHTVMRHVTGILNKLGVTSRTAAATWAVRHNIT